MRKIILAAVLAVAMVFAETALAIDMGVDGLLGTDGTAEIKAAAKDPKDYTYEVIPLLSPFNEFFLVKTDNPDPKSFLFADNDSVYCEEGEEATISLYEDSFSDSDLFADVVYENAKTKRVNGGYIFRSYDTDGGEITLQRVTSYYGWGDPKEWEDTGIKLKLPKLCDGVDYLIDTYAAGDTFFDKMDAVQEGFSSVCLYSGSYIRGNLVRDSKYWSLARSPHVDQSYYIYSPYSRESNRYLFASSIYPFRYDSLGFPSMMASISKRLDEASSYKWSSSSHAFIDVTYNGETRTYGGQGNGKGQGLSEDKITRFFKFDDKEKITLESIRKLLDAYSQVEMEDDVPLEGAITWKKLNDTVGYDGAWVRLTNCYAYLYKLDDDDYYYDSEFGAGNRNYWWGSLGYATNVWIDGRYVGDYAYYYEGATFKDFPEGDIMLNDEVLPTITYDWHYEMDYDAWKYVKVYDSVEVTEGTGAFIYSYNAEKNTWEAPQYGIAAELSELGLIDAKYADMLQLTYDEVAALDVDRNADIPPYIGYAYDGLVEPGTRFDRSAVHTGDLSVIFADAKTIAEKNGLDFSLKEGCYGMCGESMYWVYLEDSRTLIITGDGDMHTLGRAPWKTDETPFKRLIIGEGVKSIQDEAFESCYDLESCELPDTLESIGELAFINCEKLWSIRIPDGVTSIGHGVFERCYGLTKVMIPASVKTIGFFAFQGCNSLTDVYYRGTEGQWNKIAFDEYNYSLTSANIHYRCKLVGRGDVNWDGDITNADALSIFRNIFNPEQYPVDIGDADVTHDGNVTNADALLIFRHIFNPGLYPIK